MNHLNDNGEETAPPGLAGLKQDRAPARDLWPGIESRIQARRTRALSRPLWFAVGLAASALLVLGATVELGGLGGRPAPLHAPIEQAAATAPGRVPTLLPAVAHLHPETRALVKANLKIVSGAEAQIEKALAADPDGEYLKSLLASARQQKQQLHGVLNGAQR
jgi:hypothetical protein